MECYSHGAVVENDGIKHKELNHEIILVVKFNNSEALILKDPIKLTYYKFGSDTIIATDGLFYNFYMKDWASWSKDAFGGRKFTLTMHDGEIVQCEGQWWSAMSPTAKILIDQPLVSGTANDLATLQNCYVYTGHDADKEQWQKLRDTYTGPVYEYYEGEDIINSLKKQHGKLIKLFRDYKGGLCAIDEHFDHYEIKTIKGKLYFRYRAHIKPDDWYYQIFTEGKKDFSIKDARKPVEYHTCKICNSKDATIPYGDGEYYCHPCDNEMTEQDNRQNYYL